jgi:hypothetical protein
MWSVSDAFSEYFCLRPIVSNVKKTYRLSCLKISLVEEILLLYTVKKTNFSSIFQTMRPLISVIPLCATPDTDAITTKNNIFVTY